MHQNNVKGTPNNINFGFIACSKYESMQQCLNKRRNPIPVSCRTSPRACRARRQRCDPHAPLHTPPAPPARASVWCPSSSTGHSALLLAVVPRSHGGCRKVRPYCPATRYSCAGKNRACSAGGFKKWKNNVSALDIFPHRNV